MRPVSASSSVSTSPSSPSLSAPSPPLPPLPEKRTVAGCGGAGVDYLAMVLSYPNPDAKIRTTELQVQGGGNVGNALTAASRLGLQTRIFTKIADDSLGKGILSELETDGIDTSHVVIGQGGVSPFTYIIVDQGTATRTCIHTAGSPALESRELSDDAIEHFLQGVDVAYFDARLPQCAVRVAQRAAQKHLPILLDAEKPRDGLNELLSLSDYVVCSENFPKEWTGASSLGNALLEMLARLPKLAFVVVTRGASGCVMLDRRAAAVGLEKRAVEGESKERDRITGDGAGDVLDIDEEIERLTRQAEGSESAAPVCVQSSTGMSTSLFCSSRTSLQSSTGLSSTVASASGAPAGEERGEGGAMGGKRGVSIEAVLAVSTAQRLSAKEVVDTTGAGDAFIGAVLYGLCASLPRDKLLGLAATVAAAKCQKLGARPGLPSREDARLAEFLRAPVEA